MLKEKAEFEETKAKLDRIKELRDKMQLDKPKTLQAVN